MSMQFGQTSGATVDETTIDQNGGLLPAQFKESVQKAAATATSAPDPEEALAQTTEVASGPAGEEGSVKVETKPWVDLKTDAKYSMTGQIRYNPETLAAARKEFAERLKNGEVSDEEYAKRQAELQKAEWMMTSSRIDPKKGQGNLTFAGVKYETTKDGQQIPHYITSRIDADGHVVQTEITAEEYEELTSYGLSDLASDAKDFGLGLIEDLKDAGCAVRPFPECRSCPRGGPGGIESMFDDLCSALDGIIDAINGINLSLPDGSGLLDKFIDCPGIKGTITSIINGGDPFAVLSGVVQNNGLTRGIQKLSNKINGVMQAVANNGITRMTNRALEFLSAPKTFTGGRTDFFKDLIGNSYNLSVKLYLPDTFTTMSQRFDKLISNYFGDSGSGTVVTRQVTVAKSPVSVPGSNPDPDPESAVQPVVPEGESPLPTPGGNPGDTSEVIILPVTHDTAAQELGQVLDPEHDPVAMDNPNAVPLSAEESAGIDLMEEIIADAAKTSIAAGDEAALAESVPASTKLESQIENSIDCGVLAGMSNIDASTLAEMPGASMSLKTLKAAFGVAALRNGAKLPRDVVYERFVSLDAPWWD